METIDCAVIYEWEYDRDFVTVLSKKLSAENIGNAVYHAAELPEVLDSLRGRSLSVRSVVDRASDVDENAEAMAGLIKRRGNIVINDPTKVAHASDKASMHLEFLTAGLSVPYTIIISPYSTQREVKLSIGELAKLGRPFIIKPANTTGGGIGVVTGAEGLQEVIETRQHHKDDKYLLQSTIQPIILDGRRAWFRPFYVFGKVLSCWWDDQTHVYYETDQNEITTFGLADIDPIVRKIHDVCGLEFFSTEIALTADGKFVVIDYVNEMCDMRMKSSHYDGVPDNIVNEIAGRIAEGLRGLLGGGK